MTNQKPLVRPTKKNKRRLKLLESERRGITTKPKEIKRITKKYYELLYANKSDNLEVMDKFLERHKVPKLTQEEKDNLNICNR